MTLQIVTTSISFQNTSSSFRRYIVNKLLATLLLTTALFGFNHSQANEFCDEPIINTQTQAGLYLWMDCEKSSLDNHDYWFVSIVAGGESDLKQVTGHFQSNGRFRHVSKSGLENDDSLILVNNSAPKKLEFDLTVVHDDIDQIGFSLSKKTRQAVLDLTGTLSYPVYAGKHKIKVIPPVDLNVPLVNEMPTLGFSNVVVNEEELLAEITVSLNKAPGLGNTVSLNLSTQDLTAKAGADFKHLNTTLTFASDEITKTLFLELIDDCEQEMTEELVIVASNVSGATIGNTDITLTVLDSDVNYSSEELEELGYISVAGFNTGQPDGQFALPDDDIDDTQAIQAAINKAIVEGKSVYFPQGEWQVSDTLKGMMTVSEISPGKWKQDDRRKATSLIGAVCNAKRPKIILRPVDSSFNDNSTNFTRKPVVWLFSQNRDGVANSFYSNTIKGSQQPEHHQSSISFNQIIRGIDFDLNSANTSGAIAIRHPGSQGSSISDVNVDLGQDQNHSYSAFENPPGQGGGLYNVSVTGGMYAVTLNRDVRYPVIIGAEFVDQSVAAINLNALSSLVMVGFKISSQHSITGIEILDLCSGCGFANNINLVDGVFEFHHDQAIGINNNSNKSLYLNNVYFKGAATYRLFQGQNVPVLWHDGINVEHFNDFVYLGKNSIVNINAVNYFSAAGQSFGTHFMTQTAERFIDLRARHVWDETFPSFENNDVINVKTARDEFGNPFPLGTDDDTQVLQNLIDSHQKIFLPAGNYNVSRTLFLRKDTVLIGAEKHATSISAVGDWSLGEPILAIDPTISDEEARQATTIVAHIMLLSSGGSDNAMRSNSFLKWTAGRNSIVRDIAIGTQAYQGTAQSNEEISNKPAIYILDTGGGRWYGLSGEWTWLKFNSGAAGYRALKIENTRPYSEPLMLYGLNIERSRSNPQMEINNAGNVHIYSFKSESLQGAKLEDTANDVLHIIESENINLINLNGGMTPDHAIISMVNSAAVKLMNIASSRPADTYAAIQYNFLNTISGAKNTSLMHD